MRAEHWVYAIPLRLRSLLRRREVERELDEELRYHIDRQVEQLVARGMRADDARTAALRAIGGIEYQKEECRDVRRVSRLETLLRDVRFALRALTHAPAFTITAVLTLTLGIGANTAIFTVVNAVLLRPLAYADPSRLVVVQYGPATQGSTVAPATFLDWQAASRSFERAGIAEYWTPGLTGRDHPEELVGLHLSADVLPMLGVRPLLGRAFLPEEAHDGRDRVVVLSFELWNSRFAADRQIVGRAITLDGEQYTVLGVMPAGFVFAPFWATDAVVWAPLNLDARSTDRDGSSLRAFARLRSGVSLDQARAEMHAISARLERVYPGTNRNVTVIPLQEKVVGDVREPLVILLAAVGCVLLIACANVAHLQLMCASAREREFAVRTALGASRGRLLQQSLVESGLLSLVGGALGLVVARLGIQVLIVLGPPNIPRLNTISMDGEVLAFILGVVLFSGTIFGIAPALAASRANVQGALKEGSRSAADSVRRRRARSLLVISEFAMALVLLMGAGLVIRSFVALLEVKPGFDPGNTLSMKITPGAARATEPERRLAFFRQLVERVDRMPGVEAASAISHVPLNGDDWHFPFSVEGRTVARPGEDAKAQFLVVRPGYFRTMRIPIRHGRDFGAPDEDGGAHVVIVNDFMARKHWPDESAIGRRITVDDASTHPDWFTVVGVTADVKQGSWAGANEEQMYFPSEQGGPYPWNPHPLVSFLNPDYMTLVVRTTRDAAMLAPGLEQVVRSMDRDAVVSQTVTMEQAIDQQFTQPRFYLLLLGAFAGIALTLSAVGVYGVISYSVTRRRHEIGVRLALGASRRDAFRLVVRQGMQLAAIGGTIGLVAALITTRWLRTLLYGVQPTDPGTFILVTAVLAVVALVACSIPARRASRVDPIVALRCE